MVDEVEYSIKVESFAFYYILESFAMKGDRGRWQMFKGGVLLLKRENKALENNSRQLIKKRA